MRRLAILDAQADACAVPVETVDGEQKLIRPILWISGKVDKQPFTLMTFVFLDRAGKPQLQAKYTGEVVGQIVFSVPGNIRDIDALRARIQTKGG